MVMALEIAPELRKKEYRLKNSRRQKRYWRR